MACCGSDIWPQSNHRDQSGVRWKGVVAPTKMGSMMTSSNGNIFSVTAPLDLYYMYIGWKQWSLAPVLHVYGLKIQWNLGPVLHVYGLKIQWILEPVLHVYGLKIQRNLGSVLHVYGLKIQWILGPVLHAYGLKKQWSLAPVLHVYGLKIQWNLGPVLHVYGLKIQWNLGPVLHVYGLIIQGSLGPVLHVYCLGPVWHVYWLNIQWSLGPVLHMYGLKIQWSLGPVLHAWKYNGLGPVLHVYGLKMQWSFRACMTCVCAVYVGWGGWVKKDSPVHGFWLSGDCAAVQKPHGDAPNGNIFPRYSPFVRGIHRSPVNSPHKSQWREALMFSLICVWIDDWVNNREAGDLIRYRAHYDVTVMRFGNSFLKTWISIRSILVISSWQVR